MDKKKIAALTGILLILGVICGVVFVLYYYQHQGQTPVMLSGNITVNTAWQMMTNGSFPNLIIVDVRTPEEYNAMHIQGAINIPYYNTTDFSTRLSPLAGKEDHEIIVYCRLGNRSLGAWLYLNSTGKYDRIYNMLGGITEWIEMNYTVWRAPS